MPLTRLLAGLREVVDRVEQHKMKATAQRGVKPQRGTSQECLPLDGALIINFVPGTKGSLQYRLTRFKVEGITAGGSDTRIACSLLFSDCWSLHKAAHTAAKPVDCATVQLTDGVPSIRCVPQISSVDCQ